MSNKYRNHNAKKAHHKYNSQLSYSQKKREKLDYRAEYFKHNPGLFGKLYFCAYCKRPLYRSEVQVDHIMPLNNALGRNVRYNLVAACAKCNRDKSDKVDGRVVIGYASKIGDTAIFGAQTGIVMLVHTVLSIVTGVLKLIFQLLSRLMFKCGIISIVLDLILAIMIYNIFIK